MMFMVDDLLEPFQNKRLSDETKIADDQFERFADTNLSDEAPTILQATWQKMTMAKTDDDGEAPMLPKTWKASGLSRWTVMSEEELRTELEAPTILQATWQKMAMAKTDDDGGSPALPETWTTSGSYRWTVIAQTKGMTKEALKSTCL